MGLIADLTSRLNRAARGYLMPTRSGAYPYTMDDYLSWMTTAGASFPFYGTPRGTLQQSHEEAPDGTYESLVTAAYKANGVVFAVEMSRLMLFKEARFQYQRLRDGVPGELFGRPDLHPLEVPWVGGTTGALLGRMILDADFGGTSIIAKRGEWLDPLRPDRCILVGTSAHSQQVVGVAHYPDGIHSGKDPELFLGDEVAVFAPVPDPLARFRGMPWLVPIINEVMGDKAMTQHKLDFFRNGATVNQVVSLDAGITPELFDKWVDRFEKAHANRYGKAFKTLYLGAGATYSPVGTPPKDIDLRAIQGAVETRIAAAGMVPPIIVGLSEGLSSATYSNYGQARRRYADLSMRPLWRDAAAALSAIVPVPSDARLWYDDRDIPFLQEDVEDAARIKSLDSQSIRTLTDAGYDPESVVDAITSGDLKRLKHLGVYSVQLQPAGSDISGDAGRALASLIAPHLPKPEQPLLLPPKAATIDQARQTLAARGIHRPTNEQLAEEIGIAVRTLYEWKREAA